MAEEFKVIESQEAFDAAIKERLERERAKFKDYEEVKRKAAEFDKAEEAKLSELQKANAEIERLKADAKKRDAADAKRAAKEKVSKETGVPFDLIAGEDEESMAAFANAVKAYAKKPSAPKVPDGGKFADGAKAAKSDNARFVAELFGAAN